MRVSFRDRTGPPFVVIRYEMSWDALYYEDAVMGVAMLCYAMLCYAVIVGVLRVL